MRRTSLPWARSAVRPMGQVLTTFPQTIRGKIFLAFAVMTAITALLGVFATLTIRQSAGLVVMTFDRSLMSISYARSAAVDFAEMKAALERRQRSTGMAGERAMTARLEMLSQRIGEDLGIAAARARSAPAARAARDATAAVARWQAIRHRMSGPAAMPALFAGLDAASDRVNSQIELLINLTAGDAFLYRERALASIAHGWRIAAAGTLGALLLAAIVTWLLARRIVGPVAAASAAAARIARGELATMIPAGGADELGGLLASMEVMRARIRAAMEREVALRRSAQMRLVDAIESSCEGVVVADAAGRVVVANAQAGRFLGTGAALQPGRLFALPDLPAGEAGELQLDEGRWLRISRSPTREGGTVAICSDITAAKRREAELGESNLCLDAALSNMSQGLCLYDAEDRLRIANRRFYEIYRLPPALIAPGATVREVLGASLAAGNHAGRTLDELYAETIGAADAATGREPHLQQTSDGRVIAIMRGRLADGGWIATFEDVTERRRTEAQIVHMARHDALTGLANRLLFSERLEQALAQLPCGTPFALHTLDLDRFREVNDTLGHYVGDLLLREVAARILACARETDTVARLGSDEFAILQAGIARPDDAAMLAQRVLRIVAAPYEVGGHRVVIGASCGIAVAPGNGPTGETLLRNADTALDRAKADGRGIWRFFEPEMNARLQLRRALEIDLREAVEADALVLFFRPLIDVAAGTVCGCEALLRWPHPTRGVVSPADFVPLAEETGLILPIGRWVLHHACSEAASWPAPLAVSVNVSPVQFRSPGITGWVEAALEASGLDPGRLELEITESVLLHDNAATLAALHELRALGVQVALDDFGTGYASLSYLRSFPFDRIKIDQSFVRDMVAKEESASIVRAIAGLARSLGIRVIAEGVETVEQRDRLRRYGCTEMQGFLFSRPRPAGEIPALLRNFGRKVRVVA